MAIKVGGTSVIDDSRNLQNIASVDATTVAALSAAGVGDITGVTAGGGLTGGGTSGAVTVSHSNTSSQASVNNSGNTVIQDITLDTYGHITNINSTTISAGSGSIQAWVNFNGTGTVSIRADGNVSSITDSGTGYYRINMSPAISDTNYATTGTVSTGTDGYPIVATVNSRQGIYVAPTTTQQTVWSKVTGSNTDRDVEWFHASIVR